MASEWTTAKFLAYIEKHAHDDEPAGFTGGQVRRLCDLAGVNVPRLEEYRMGSVTNYVLRPTMADYLIREARKRTEGQ